MKHVVLIHYFEISLTRACHRLISLHCLSLIGLLYIINQSALTRDNSLSPLAFPGISWSWERTKNQNKKTANISKRSHRWAFLCIFWKKFTALWIILGSSSPPVMKVNHDGQGEDYVCAARWPGQCTCTQQRLQPSCHCRQKWLASYSLSLPIFESFCFLQFLRFSPSRLKSSLKAVT